MKTIKDIITRKNRYASIVDDNGDVVVKGDLMRNSNMDTKKVLGNMLVGGPQNIVIEKNQSEVSGYSKKLPYRHQQNGDKPTLVTSYTYYYTEGGKRLKSKDFRSLLKLMEDLKGKTPKVVMGATTMEVLETE